VIGLRGGQNGHHATVRADLTDLLRHEEIKLVQRVFLSADVTARRAVLFAGVDRENGCADVCVRAGATLARLDPHPVCVVDANLRAPARPAGGDTANGHGLVAALAHAGPIVTFACRTTPDNLWLMPSGSVTSDPDLLLTPDRVRPRMQELGGAFDRVLVIAPPINLYAESLALSQLVDGVVLVLEAHTTRREIVRDVKTRLDALDVPLLGVVLNNRTFPIPDPVYRLL
jgi:Mrp family chromosome partitioning ATPase